MVAEVDSLLNIWIWALLVASESLTDWASHVDDGLSDTGKSVKTGDVVHEFGGGSNASNLNRVDITADTYNKATIRDITFKYGRFKHYCALQQDMFRIF